MSGAPATEEAAGRAPKASRRPRQARKGPAYAARRPACRLAAAVAVAVAATFGLLAGVVAAPADAALEPADIGSPAWMPPLPHAMRDPSAVWDGACNAYIVGSDGTGGPTSLLRFTAQAGGSYEVLGSFPALEGGAAMAWIDGAAYLFGGRLPDATYATDPYVDPDLRSSDAVYHIDAATGAIAQVATLPIGLADLSAVSVGGQAYLFGGVAAAGESLAIYRFDPPGTITKLGVELPPGAWPVAATLVDDQVLVVGPESAWEFHPADGSLLTDPVAAPGGPPAWTVWDGERALVLSPVTEYWNGAQAHTSHLAFQPISGQEAAWPWIMWPNTMETAAYVYDGDRTVYAFGGANGVGPALDHAARFGHATDCPVLAGMSATAMELPCGGLDVVFADATQTQATIVSRTWSFSDGATASGPEATHAFIAPGLASATLTLTGLGGQLHTTTQEWLVPAGACPPIVEAPPAAWVVAGSVLELCTAATPAMGGTVSYGLSAAAPPGIVLDAATGCMQWTPTIADLGTHPCITVTATEAPSGLAATACLLVEVVRRPPAGWVGGPRGWVPCELQPKEWGCHLELNQARSEERVLRERVGTDLDADGVLDASDNCPVVPNPQQADMDLDRAGDACDIDRDGDGVPQEGTAGLFLDGCPDVPDADQRDGDGDGKGDACDLVGAAAPARRGRAAAAPASPGPTPSASDSGWPLPLLPTLAGIAAAITGVLVAHRRKAPLVILFSRLRQSDLSQQRSRARILAILDADPGLHFRELVRRAGQSRGTVLHHLHILETAGLVIREPAGRYVALYATATTTPRNANRDALRTQLARDVLAAAGASAGRGASIADLARRLGVSDRAVAYHVRRLAARGLVEVTQAGRRHEVRATSEGHAASAGARDGAAAVAALAQPQPIGAEAGS